MSGMYKSCSRCGKIHDMNYKCNVGRPKIDWNKYKSGADKLHQTSAWETKSFQIRNDAQWLCEVCRDNGKLNAENLEVHHIEKLQENPLLFLDDNNLICLCTKHHKQADRGQLSNDYLKSLAYKRVERVSSITVI